MNHFLLPVERRPEGGLWGLDAGGRYGIQAMELLINAMLKKGAQRSRLQAKVFGGASLMGTRSTLVPAVGEANTLVVRDFLSGDGIAVVAEDLGGTRGRVIHFHTDSFTVWRRYLKDPAVEQKVVQEELAVWKSRRSGKSGQGDFVDFTERGRRGQA
jgi:chemotaxis protein CheD